VHQDSLGRSVAARLEEVGLVSHESVLLVTVVHFFLGLGIEDQGCELLGYNLYDLWLEVVASTSGTRLDQVLDLLLTDGEVSVN
jgi:hypothetical protein